MYAFDRALCISKIPISIDCLLNSDHRLKNCVIYEDEVNSWLDCAHLCLSQWPKCRSINLKKKKTYFVCQLNNQTRRTKPDELVPNPDFNYFEKLQVRNCYNYILYISFGHAFNTSLIINLQCS